ncbi:MAG: AAA family ATPase [Bifidobacteriaceae bacterium]|jgi:predicted AAA+ superfamily ATPase|nr:AAA family ATPase [Bifidobacteriaceae bacterium]
MIERILDIQKALKSGKTLLLYGPRQVGKTTLIDKYIEDNQNNLKIVKYNGDNLSVQHAFSVNDISTLSKYVDGYDVLVIDEAQQIDNIGMSLKKL